MRKITKKVIKRIKEGHYDDLIGAIEYLIETYNEDKWNNGYKACLDDLSVRSQRLAEVIFTKFQKRSIDAPFTVNSLAETIESYYSEALKQK